MTLPRRLRGFLVLAILATAQSTVAQNSPIAPAFTVTLNGFGPSFSPPAIVDLGAIAGCQVGIRHIVFTTFRCNGGFQGSCATGLSRKLHVICKSSVNGQWIEAPGWPADLPAAAQSSPAVGDLTVDGIPEIVVGYGGTFDLNANGGVRAFRRDGTQLWDRPSLDLGDPDAFTQGVVSTPAIADVDGDGDAEVAWGSLDFRVYLVDGDNGANHNGNWPLDVQDTVFSSPALHDLDGDGKKEIIVGTDGPGINGNPQNIFGRLRVLRQDTAADLPGFPKIFDQVIFSSPVVGDIDGDGQPEIVHGTGTFWTNANNGAFPAPLHRVYAWNCDGTPVTGWSGGVVIQGQVVGSPALGDLEGGDGIPEVVVTADNTSPATTYRVYAFRGNGSQLFVAQPSDFGGTTNIQAKDPVIADILGDTNPEVIVPYNTELAVFDRFGNLLIETDGFPDSGSLPNFYTPTGLAGVAIGEVDPGDNKIDVVTVSAAPFGVDPPNTEVSVWNPVNRTSLPTWGQFRQNPTRSGVLPGTGSCTSQCTPSASTLRFFTIPPCRAVDTRDAGLGGPSPLQNVVRRPFNLRTACPAIPVGVVAVSVNITAVTPGGTGRITLTPSNCFDPISTSSIHFNTNATRASNAIASTAVDGTGWISAEAQLNGTGQVHVVIDVNGYFIP